MAQPVKEIPLLSCDSGDNSAQPRRVLGTVNETAMQLGFSTCWVRRHLSELPVVRFGRMIRIDLVLLSENIKTKMRDGKSLGPERTSMPSRYQRGHVYKKGKKVKVWYGKIREDACALDGQTIRKQRNVKLGTVTELPTKNAARERLAQFLSNPRTGSDVTYENLVERWLVAEGVTMKLSTLGHYRNALRAYVLPKFGKRKINLISREDIQLFLAEKAKQYSESTLRSIRVVMRLTLGWAEDCGWLPKNPCTRVRLPRRTGGRKVNRTVFSPEQINSLAERLNEPYATLVLLIAAAGLRISEAIAVKRSDFVDGVLHVTRRAYSGKVDKPKSRKSERNLPIDAALMSRIGKLGTGEWVFHTSKGTLLNPGNVLKRYVRPAARDLGISQGGWHDFRHTLSTKLRRSGTHPKVVSDILGQEKVNLAMDVYDRTELEDFVQPLSDVARELFPNVPQSESTIQI